MCWRETGRDRAMQDSLPWISTLFEWGTLSLDEHRLYWIQRVNNETPLGEAYVQYKTQVRRWI
ncbi:hypothetical protein [Lusitaniella coriacea]|uniref:hypothetical protein n=1 Tax=Lusitaniella coriacea TaxID=1983105 RepID=UPI003CF520BD